ncbi:Vacuolar membrane-associated protein IML1 [Grifola frondosa]|uniref:Vacuolar membrane-associated protein IML1 n=1 Tax=Grifola frondosa TaxID=5627 RepID=A0A1C7LYQ7_GRIFR|nr:Vacuolar membrane-associated protein IML1 [Grifola frondosa]
MAKLMKVLGKHTAGVVNVARLSLESHAIGLTFISPRATSLDAAWGNTTLWTTRSSSCCVPNRKHLIGDSKALTTWVHDPKESPTVTLNHSWWPGVAEGDMLRLSSNNMQSSSGFLFIVPRDEGSLKHQLQISVPRPVAETFGFRNNGEALLTKVDKEKWSADYVELTFQDQYLGRNDMWRLGNDLVGQCVYMEQEISFIGVITAKVQGIYINGNKVSAAYVTSSTKTIYRSLSAKLTIFIQVCRELWEFAGDGERYNEKIVHSFLPALFSKWREAGTNHIVTIVLISRVYYDLSEIDYAAGPLRVDDEGRWYKDFFRVITDLEVLHDWKPTLRSLKDSFWAFQRDVLLSHHCHRSALYPTSLEAEGSSDHVRLVGQLSFAHDGPLLEALNLGLNPMETHYIDRSLSLTGSLTIIVTPGTGYFRVSKQLLRLTTTRLLDQGFAVELVSLAKPPLHLSPIFSFEGSEPEIRADASGKISSRALDPLWGGNDDDDTNANGQEKKTFWWEPFWMSVSFWDRQMDLPFRQDRFVARAKMHEIEMLGLLDHDVLSGIQIPYLPFDDDDVRYAPLITQEDADKFDMEVFAAKPDPTTVSRNSIASSGSAPTELKRSSSNRISDVSKISPIEESPRRVISGPPAEGDTLDLEQRLSVAISTSGLSTSPSQSSILSNRSARSHRSTISASQSTPRPPGLTHFAEDSVSRKPLRSPHQQ